MIILAITGSVGMGKSEASKYFFKRDIAVFDSDRKIASFYKRRDVIQELKINFPSIIIKDSIDKIGLAKIVFNDLQKLQFLEALLHKKLKQEQNFWLRKKIREKKEIVVFDIPLLFEKDNLKKYDLAIVVSCSKEIQKRRVLKREGWNEDRLNKTLKQQMSDDKKQKLADIVIKTDRGKRYLLNNIQSIIKVIKNTKIRKINDILKEFKYEKHCIRYRDYGTQFSKRP